MIGIRSKRRQNGGHEKGPFVFYAREPDRQSAGRFDKGGNAPSTQSGGDDAHGRIAGSLIRLRPALMQRPAETMRASRRLAHGVGYGPPSE